MFDWKRKAGAPRLAAGHCLDDETTNGFVTRETCSRIVGPCITTSKVAANIPSPSRCTGQRKRSNRWATSRRRHPFGWRRPPFDQISGSRQRNGPHGARGAWGGGGAGCAPLRAALCTPVGGHRDATPGKPPPTLVQGRCWAGGVVHGRAFARNSIKEPWRGHARCRRPTAAHDGSGRRSPCFDSSKRLPARTVRPRVARPVGASLRGARRGHGQPSTTWRGALVAGGAKLHCRHYTAD